MKTPAAVIDAGSTELELRELEVELVAGDSAAVKGPPPETKIPHPMPHIHEHP
ncbi:hypothetical protein ACIHAX_30800 [Nocardia sp. NPDC051929]|uniref:hypothetical protein n=1 Tax=unclassified Nocardia TaxID=2637762 RepID=UPI00341F4439